MAQERPEDALGQNNTLPRVWDSARQYAIDGAFTAHNGYSS